MNTVNTLLGANYYFILFGHFLVSLLLIFFEINELNSIYYIISLVFFVYILRHNFYNMIFFIRTFFLGIIGFLAMGVKIIDPNAIFAIHLQESQTVEIAVLMFLLTNIALFGSEIGFMLGTKIKINKKRASKYDSKSLFYFLFFMLILLAFFISLTSNSVIGSGITYASDLARGTNMPIGTIPTIANIILFILVLLYFKFKDYYKFKDTKKYLYLILFGIFFLILYSELIRGIRLHALNGVFGLIVLYNVYNNENLKLTYKYMFIGIFLFFVIQVFGILRQISEFSDFDNIVTIILNSFDRISSTSSHVMFNQGTINNIAATFSGTIYFLQQNIIDFHYGKGYFDYILRIPPKFLYPDRPEDLAWMFSNHGYTSGGGFFELAEAYLNFGVVGAFIVPAIISFFIAYAYKSFLINKYSIFSSIVIFSILANLLRGLLYQSFALYKGVIVGLFLLLTYYIIKQVFLKRN